MLQMLTLNLQKSPSYTLNGIANFCQFFESYYSYVGYIINFYLVYIQKHFYNYLILCHHLNTLAGCFIVNTLIKCSSGNLSLIFYQTKNPVTWLKPHISNKIKTQKKEIHLFKSFKGSNFIMVQSDHKLIRLFKEHKKTIILVMQHDLEKLFYTQNNRVFQSPFN